MHVSIAGVKRGCEERWARHASIQHGASQGGTPAYSMVRAKQTDTSTRAGCEPSERGVNHQSGGGMSERGVNHQSLVRGRTRKRGHVESARTSFCCILTIASKWRCAAFASASARDTTLGVELLAFASAAMATPPPEARP